MIVSIQSPPTLPMMQEQKLLTHRWLSCWGWGMERVSLVFSYKGSRLIRKWQWRTNNNNLQLAVGYLNANINRKTQNTELEIGTDRCSQTQQNPLVDQYWAVFGSQGRSRSGFWRVLEPNRTNFVVQTLNVGELPRPVANTSRDRRRHSRDDASGTSSSSGPWSAQSSPR